MEIVNNYDIDGLHLDYIRWNEYHNTHPDILDCDSSRSENELELLDGVNIPEDYSISRVNRPNHFLFDINHPYSGGVPNGFTSWEDYWRSSVTTFVEMLHDSIQTVKPYVRLSVAALGKYNWSGWQGYGSVYQDAAKWFNEGTIDQLTPMHYHWNTAGDFYNMLTGGCPNCWRQWIQTGIDNGNLFSV